MARSGVAAAIVVVFAVMSLGGCGVKAGDVVAQPSSPSDSPAAPGPDGATETQEPPRSIGDRIVRLADACTQAIRASALRATTYCTVRQSPASGPQNEATTALGRDAQALCEELAPAPPHFPARLGVPGYSSVLGTGSRASLDCDWEEAEPRIGFSLITGREVPGSGPLLPDGSWQSVVEIDQRDVNPSFPYDCTYERVFPDGWDTYIVMYSTEKCASHFSGLLPSLSEHQHDRLVAAA